MDKLSKIFASCRQQERAALIIFCSCGFPDLERSEQAIEAAIEAGADIIELGVPFSDPMADGAVIRQASGVALRNGATLAGILDLAARLSQKHPETGFILFSYMNVLFNYGLDRVCRKLSAIGVDGILAVDLPLEEAAELELPCRDNGLHLIPLVSPATSPQRAAAITARATGFVYSVNVCGVTGVREELPAEMAAQLAELKKISPAPVAAGFGVTDGAAARRISQVADGVIVGSAVVKILAREQDFQVSLEESRQFIRELARNCRRCP